MIKKRSARMALLACASVASLGLLAGASPAAAKTKTKTVNTCLNTSAFIPDRPATSTTPGTSYASVGIPVSVPKFKGKPQDGVITAFTSAGVRITHTFSGDLVLLLVSPGGRVIDLANNRGEDGDGYGTGSPGCSGSLVLFGDTFGTSIVTPGNTGDDPISGSFRPEEPLSSFVGLGARGTWTLIAVDTAVGDTGTINAFSLNFTYKYKVKPKKKKKK